jgi:hypothetical protein
MTMKAFGQALSGKGFEKKRRADGVFVQGLELMTGSH